MAWCLVFVVWKFSLDQFTLFSCVYEVFIRRVFSQPCEMSFTSGSAFECHPFGLSFGNMEETQSQKLTKQSAVMTWQIKDCNSKWQWLDLENSSRKRTQFLQPILGVKIGFPMIWKTLKVRSTTESHLSWGVESSVFSVGLNTQNAPKTPGYFAEEQGIIYTQSVISEFNKEF